MLSDVITLGGFAEFQSSKRERVRTHERSIGGEVEMSFTLRGKGGSLDLHNIDQWEQFVRLASLSRTPRTQVRAGASFPERSVAIVVNPQFPETKPNLTPSWRVSDSRTALRLWREKREHCMTTISRAYRKTPDT